MRLNLNHRFIAALILLMITLPGVQAQISSESMKDLEQRYPILSAQYTGKFQGLSVEYIVAIDFSRSMNSRTANNSTTYFEEVKRGLIQFLQAIPDNSKISIIGFGETVRWVQIPIAVTPESRSSIANTISGLRAEENYTDLKGAVKYLIEGCASTSTIKYLFAFTDFNNDPMGNSPFSRVSWSELQQNYALISKTSMIEAFALKLPIAQNAGRELPEVRRVFPGLNVIDFNTVSLQNWFDDRSGKMVEQNLWTFVSNDLDKIKEKHQIKLNAAISLGGNLLLSAEADSLPSYIKGINLSGIDSIRNHANKFSFKFTSARLNSDQERVVTGKFSTQRWWPVASVKRFLGLATGTLMVSAEKEIEQLYANMAVTSKNQSGNTQSRFEEYMSYKTPINASRAFIITWPLWLFFMAGIIFLIIIARIVLSLWPRYMVHYAVRINGGEITPLKSYQEYVVSNGKGDKEIHIPENFEFVIYHANADPSSLIIKNSIAVKIKKGIPTLAVDGKLMPQRKCYRLPCNKKIIFSLGISQITLEFFRI